MDRERMERERLETERLETERLRYALQHGIPHGVGLRITTNPGTELLMDTTDISTAIRDRLIESRVIGDIIYDFSPLMQLSINFGNKRISLGDILLPVDVQSRPTSIDMSYDVLSIPSSFQGSKLVLVMTEAHAFCEHLHWLATKSFNPRIGTAPAGLPPQIDFQLRELAPYRPPRPTVTHKMVFILFKQNDARQSITQPFSEYIFSTRGFADFNDLGPPIAAAFCYVRNQ